MPNSREAKSGYYQDSKVYGYSLVASKGPSINYVFSKLAIFDPLSLLVVFVFLFSFELKNEQNNFLISALASKNGSNPNSEGTLLGGI